MFMHGAEDGKQLSERTHMLLPPGLGCVLKLDLALGLAMDTDDLSEIAYGIIVRAASVSDTLKSNLGASSKGVENEDDWLRNVREFLKKIVEDPGGYVEYWNLEEEECITAIKLREIALELYRLAGEILSISISCRNN